MACRAGRRLKPAAKFIIISQSFCVSFWSTLKPIRLIELQIWVTGCRRTMPSAYRNAPREEATGCRKAERNVLHKAREEATAADAAGGHRLPPTRRTEIGHAKLRNGMGDAADQRANCQAAGGHRLPPTRRTEIGLEMLGRIFAREATAAQAAERKTTEATGCRRLGGPRLEMVLAAAERKRM